MGKFALVLITILTLGSVAGFGLARFTISGANPMWSTASVPDPEPLTMTASERRELADAIGLSTARYDRDDDRRCAHAACAGTA
jgi:hypothetical protein